MATATSNSTIEGKSAPPTRGTLLRILGIGFGIAIAIGGTIGAGILRTPGLVAAQLPIKWVFVGVWVLGAVYALLGVFNVSELGAMMPRAGGYYVFARRAFGEYPAFIVGWTDWLAQCGSSAAVSIIIAEYFGDLFPFFHPHNIAIAIACAVPCVIAVLQWQGIRWGSRIQDVMSSLQALAFFAFIVAAYFFAHPRAAETPMIVPAGAALFTAFVISMQQVIYTYDGWYTVIYFGEEIKNPGRDVPRSMLRGILSIATIYILVNLALLHVMPLSAIAGKDLAMGSAMQTLFGPKGDTLLRALTIVSMVSAVNAFQLFASRIPFAMGRDRLAFPILTSVNRGGTPTWSLLFSTIACVAFILSGSFEKVAAVMAFFFVADYGMSYAAVFVLREREPDAERPYRAFGYPWTTGIALIGSLVFLVSAIIADRENSLWALAVLGCSVPLYFVARALRQRAVAP